VPVTRTAAGVCLLQLNGSSTRRDQSAVEYMETGDDRGHYWYGHYTPAPANGTRSRRSLWEKYSTMRDRPPPPRRPDYQKRPALGTTPIREAAYGPAYQTAIAWLISAVRPTTWPPPPLP